MVLEQRLLEFVIVLPACLLDHVQALGQFFQLRVSFAGLTRFLNDVFEDLYLFGEGLGQLSQMQRIQDRSLCFLLILLRFMLQQIVFKLHQFFLLAVQNLFHVLQIQFFVLKFNIMRLFVFFVTLVSEGEVLLLELVDSCLKFETGEGVAKFKYVCFPTEHGFLEDIHLNFAVITLNYNAIQIVARLAVCKNRMLNYELMNQEERAGDNFSGDLSRVLRYIVLTLMMHSFEGKDA